MGQLSTVGHASDVHQMHINYYIESVSIVIDILSPMSLTTRHFTITAGVHRCFFVVFFVEAITSTPTVCLGEGGGGRL